MRLTTTMAGAVILGAVASQGVSAGANFTVLTQDRSITGNALVEDFLTKEFLTDFDSDAAPDFAPFNEGAAAQASITNALGAGGGTQDSQFLSNGMTACGTHFANGESYDADAYGDGTGRSFFEATFSVAAPSTYLLTGSIGAFDNGTTDILLDEVGGGAVFADGVFGPADSRIINASGPIGPGNVRLRVASSGSAIGEFFGFDYSSGDFDLTLTITGPCEGDVDGNGVVDVNDISYVIFRLGDTGAPGTVDGDADGNGIVDVNDIAYVIFRLGPCP